MPLCGKCKLGMLRGAAPKPGCGIAERLAAIFPPAPRAAADIRPAERAFSPFRAPTKLSFGAAEQFDAQQLFPRAPQAIAQPQPDEMRCLMSENARELRPGAIER